MNTNAMNTNAMNTQQPLRFAVHNICPGPDHQPASVVITPPQPCPRGTQRRTLNEWHRLGLPLRPLPPATVSALYRAMYGARPVVQHQTCSYSLEELRRLGVADVDLLVKHDAALPNGASPAPSHPCAVTRSLASANRETAASDASRTNPALHHEAASLLWDRMRANEDRLEAITEAVYALGRSCQELEAEHRASAFGLLSRLCALTRSVDSLARSVRPPRARA